MTDAQARAFLKQASVVHLAGTTDEGLPLLRSLNAAVSEDWLLFHGAPAGEKVSGLGRQAVAQVEEVVAAIPSYFTDPERACPATTFFRSVQVHGTLERIDDPHAKAAALQLLMQRYQPEGGHAPVSFDDPRYQNALRGLLVFGLRLDQLTGKAKLGQNRSPEDACHIMEQLWRRGAPGDARAVALMFEYHPESARPARFRGPLDSWLWPELAAEDVAEATRLLQDQYWARGVAPEAFARAQLGSVAWLGARDPSGHLVATARANSDGVLHAYLADVVVAPEWRGRGLGKKLVELLLDHPRVRDARYVRLATADAQSFYAPFGFEPEEQIQFEFPVKRLLLRRGIPQHTP